MELRPAELLKRWKAGQFAPVYYFVGEEASAKEEALDKLKAAFKADDFNLREYVGDVGQECASILSECMTLPVFSDRRLIIVKNAKIPAEAKTEIAAYLKDPLKSTTLVLFCDEKKVEAKDPLVKPCDALGGLCVFAPLGEDEAQARLLAQAKTLGKTMSVEAASALVAEAGTDWAILSQELEKVALFVDKAPKIEPDDVMACLGYRKAANPWAIGDLIESRNVKGALTHLRGLMKEGKADEQARMTLYKIRDIVSRQLKARRMQRAQVPVDQIGRSIRIYNAWVAGKFIERMAKLTESRLRRDLKHCIEAETALNSKAWLDPRVEVEQLLIDVCR